MHDLSHSYLPVLKSVEELRGRWLAYDADATFVETHPMSALAHFLGVPASETKEGLIAAGLVGRGIRTTTREKLLGMPMLTEVVSIAGASIGFLWLGSPAAEPWTPLEQLNGRGREAKPPPAVEPEIEKAMAPFLIMHESHLQDVLPVLRSPFRRALQERLESPSLRPPTGPAEAAQRKVAGFLRAAAEEQPSPKRPKTENDPPSPRPAPAPAPAPNLRQWVMKEVLHSADLLSAIFSRLTRGEGHVAQVCSHWFSAWAAKLEHDRCLKPDTALDSGLALFLRCAMCGESWETNASAGDAERLANTQLRSTGSGLCVQMAGAVYFVSSLHHLLQFREEDASSLVYSSRYGNAPHWLLVINHLYTFRKTVSNELGLIHSYPGFAFCGLPADPALVRFGCNPGMGPDCALSSANEDIFWLIRDGSLETYSLFGSYAMHLRPSQFMPTQFVDRIQRRCESHPLILFLDEDGAVARLHYCGMVFCGDQLCLAFNVVLMGTDFDDLEDTDPLPACDHCWGNHPRILVFNRCWPYPPYLADTLRLEQTALDDMLLSIHSYAGDLYCVLQSGTIHVLNTRGESLREFALPIVGLVRTIVASVDHGRIYCALVYPSEDPSEDSMECSLLICDLCGRQLDSRRLDGVTDGVPGPSQALRIATTDSHVIIYGCRYPMEYKPLRPYENVGACAGVRSFRVLGTEPPADCDFAGDQSDDGGSDDGESVTGSMWLLEAVRDQCDADDLRREISCRSGAVDPDVADANGTSVLLHAIRSLQTDTALLLLDLGACCFTDDAAGCTPLHAAARVSDAEVVRSLIHARADIRARDDDARTPADVAGDASIRDLLEFLEGDADGDDNDDVQGRDSVCGETDDENVAEEAQLEAT